ncbi:cullin-2 isoform X2 [Toxorhynchites rutilus septentrionalis]|uniref:cullin-2 isoform X2 n=1 Tax=Toxorhynchites rutilus septentrionalis TaxID=329112 RepID=UPI0024797E76|nr:cullin-2 isoform X2 [Toxorhynchites rutilus septentrionalis]
MSLKPKRIDFDQTWSELKDTVKEVITLGSVRRDVWSNRFVDIYSICVAHPEPLADKLYAQTRLFLEAHVRNLLQHKVFPSVIEVDGDQRYTLLYRYYDAWTEYSKGVEYLNHLYLYLNQQHIKKQKTSEVEVVYGCVNHDSQEQLEIGELGLDIWRQHMIENLGEALVKQLIEGIRDDRSNKNQNSDFAHIIKSIIQSFVCVEEYKKKGSLELYQNIFEKPFLTDSGEFYKLEANKLLQTCTVSRYMEETIKKLDEENKRALKYLHISSISKLRKECEQRIITDNLEFLYSECNEMVTLEKQRDLKNLYTILKPVPDALKLLVNTFYEHIRNKGVQMVSTIKGETVHVQFVEGMLQVHEKYEKMIANTFASDPIFLSALDKACSSFINSKTSDNQSNRSAELVSKYCDSLLKKSKISESEIETKLTKSITIFKYIEDKDVYQKFYSRMLAKRLIHDQSQSMDVEEMMINKLKQACGYEFTNKLHRMFTDISVSGDLNAKFNQFLKQHEKQTGINISIKILQAGAWPFGPTQVPAGFAVPQEFEKPVRLFESFYHINFSGRKLTWLHHLCHGELKIVLANNRTYIVTMQTYQMAILLLFETSDSMSYKELQESLQLNNDMFQKHIMSLIDSKLLLADSEIVDENCKIILNKEYTNRRTKFKITAALHKETPQEIVSTIISVDDDRKMYLQATIVRIMKSRKVLRHNALIQEIISQSKATFAPSIAMIKKCIESLIDKQYIERTPNSGDEYSYVA